MTKQFFLLTVTTEGGPIPADEAYLRGEIEAFARALYEYHAGGHARALVSCAVVDPERHGDTERILRGDVC